MVKLLIGLNYKEFENSSNDLMDARSRLLKDLLIIGNICKMNAWVYLGFSYHFMHIWKLGLCIKVTFSSKSKLSQMNLRQNVSKLTYYFT